MSNRKKSPIGTILKQDLRQNSIPLSPKMS